MWDVWKERNHIFNAAWLTYLEVAFLAFKELGQVVGVLHPMGVASVLPFEE